MVDPNIEKNLKIGTCPKAETTKVFYY